MGVKSRTIRDLKMLAKVLAWSIIGTALAVSLMYIFAVLMP